MHWSSPIRDDVYDAMKGTEWEIEAKGDKGPLEFTHADGTTVAAVSSSITGGYAVTYEPADGVTDAIVDKHVSWQDISNMSEWLVNVLNQHSKRNE